MTGAEAVVVIVAVGLLLLAVAVPLTITLRTRHLVRDSSTALAGLTKLNVKYADALTPLPSLQASFRHVAKSKSALERFDLTAFMTTCVLEREIWFEGQIAARQQRMAQYARYSGDLGSLGEQQIGRSGHARVKTERYNRVELRLFQNRIIATPTPFADVVATASYTSPKGQNSYARSVVWNFDQLVAGLRHARRERERRNTTEFMRQRERSLMTPKLRTDVLRRDRSRCRMCGASASDGAILHIDHIVPVSRGGRTTMDNLQTLCQSCNLGKSNRFIG